MAELTDAIVYYAVFLLSTTLHEAAHAWAAMRGGDLTAYHGGQVSLDPRPHIKREPFGMVVLPILTALVTHWPIGYASAPFDPRWARRYPSRAALMALAGPAGNLVIAIIAGVAIRLGMLAGLFHAPQEVSFGHITASDAGSAWSAAGLMLGAFFSVNVLLAAFNLIPLPPLDGSGAVPLVLSKPAAERYQDFIWSTPAIGFIGMFVAWQLFGLVVHPIFFGAVKLLYPEMTYG